MTRKRPPATVGHDLLGDYWQAPDLRFASDVYELLESDAKLQGNAQLVLDGTPFELIRFRFKDQVARPITLTLATTGILTTAGLAAPYAELVCMLDLGVGGYTFPVEIDFLNGQTIGICTSALTVYGDYRMLQGVAPPANPPTPRVAAAIGVGSIAGLATPQRTLSSEQDMTQGGNYNWNIPAFAKSFRTVFLPAWARLFADQINPVGLAVASCSIGRSPGEEIPLVNGATVLSLLPRSFDLITQHATIFYLSL